MRLSEAHVGDQLHLLTAEDKLALRWLIYNGVPDGVSAVVMSLSKSEVMLSTDERVVTVPAWVAQQTLVHCIKTAAPTSTGPISAATRHWPSPWISRICVIAAKCWSAAARR